VNADALIERLKTALGDKALVLDAHRLAQDHLGDPSDRPRSPRASRR